MNSLFFKIFVFGWPLFVLFLLKEEIYRYLRMPKGFGKGRYSRPMFIIKIIGGTISCVILTLVLWYPLLIALISGDI